MCVCVWGVGGVLCWWSLEGAGGDGDRCGGVRVGGWWGGGGGGLRRGFRGGGVRGGWVGGRVEWGGPREEGDREGCGRCEPAACQGGRGAKTVAQSRSSISDMRCYC